MKTLKIESEGLREQIKKVDRARGLSTSEGTSWMHFLVLDKKPSIGDVIKYNDFDVTVIDVDSIENTHDYLSFVDDREFFSMTFKFEDGLRHSVVATVGE